jgi:hypothetical protein
LRRKLTLEAELMGYQSGDILAGFIGVIDARFSLPRVWLRPLQNWM